MRSLLFNMALAVTAMRAEYYVAPNGSDTAPGTRERPFGNITRARDEVRELVKAGLKEDVTVWLLHGRHVVEAPIELGPEDSGTAEHSITYRGELTDPSDPSDRSDRTDRSDRSDHGPRAVISGGRVIGGWEQRGELWQTTVPAAEVGEWVFRELFVNGTRAQRARHPNAGVLRVENVGPDKRTSFTFRAGDIPDSPDVIGSELVFFHDWSVSRVGVKSVDPATRELVPVAPLGATGNMWVMDSWERNPPYFLENSRAFLDAPGEWFLDASDGLLSYRPRAGESLAESEIIAPFAKQLLVINGDPTNNVPVRNLAFRDIAFEHSFYAPTRWAGVQAGWDGTRGTRRARPTSHLRSACAWPKIAALKTCNWRISGRPGSTSGAAAIAARSPARM